MMRFIAPIKHPRELSSLEDRPLQTDGMSGQSRCISDEDNVAYPQSGNCISDLQCVDQDDELESPETAEGYEATHTDITRRCKVAGLNMETGGNS